MKNFMVILILATSASSDYTVKTREDMLKYREECVAELSVPADHVDKYKKWDFPDDVTTHCFMRCVLQKFDLFDDTHGYNVENVHNQMVGGSHADHTDDTHAKIEKCADKNTQGSPVCEWAYRGAKCFMAQNLNLVKMSVHSHDHDHGNEHAHHHH